MIVCTLSTSNQKNHLKTNYYEKFKKNFKTRIEKPKRRNPSLYSKLYGGIL